MTENSKVIVVGSANIDVVVTTPRLPAPGETVLGHSITRGLGGKGANQAVAAARAGAPTMLVAAIGKDEFSDRVRDGLQAEGIDLSFVVSHPAAPTGAAVVTVDDAGANSIVVTRGANGLLDANAVDVMAPILCAGDVILMQLEIPIDACSRAAAIANEARAITILNAAPAPQTADELRPLLPHLDLLIVNEVEATSLSGVAPENASAWPAVASQLRAMGPRAVIITLGERGAFLADRNGSTPISTPAVQVIDTTGAGDAFCGYVASSLAADLPLAVAVRLACIAGALATTQLGAQTAIPQLDAVHHLDAITTPIAPRDGTGLLH